MKKKTTTKKDEARQVEVANGLKLFVAGGASGAVARVFGSPFARIAILMQTNTLYTDAEGMKSPTRIDYRESQWHRFGQLAQFLWRSEGVKGFFRGNGVDVLRSIPMLGISYLSYECYKDLIMRSSLFVRRSSKAEIGVRMLAGGLSGLTSTIVTYPLDLLRTRMCVTTKYEGSIVSMMREIVREEGFGSLFRGAPVACMGIVPNLAINFSTFELSRNFLEERFGQSHVRPDGTSVREPKVWMSLVSGMFSGLVALTATFPIDFIQRRMMLQGMAGQDRIYTSMCYSA